LRVAAGGDGGAAALAGFAFATVDEQFLFEITGLAIGFQEIAQRGAAAFDGMGEDAANGVGQFGIVAARDFSGRAHRPHAGREQGFGDIDVADADDDALVHQEGLHRRAAAAARREQVVAVEGVAERFGAEVAQQFVRRVRGLPEQTAEAARVVETQYAVVVEHQVDMIVRCRRYAGIEHPQRSGHAEMQERRARVGVQQQVLGAPLGAFDAAADEHPLDLVRNRPAQIRPSQYRAYDDTTFDVRRDPATRGFDFGQFGHDACYLSRDLPCAMKRATVGRMRWDAARRIVLGLVAWLCAGTATAALVTNRTRLDTLDVYRGLPANSVRAVYPDRDGFVWIGTQDGLARYDGEHIDVWRHRRDDPGTLAENSIVAITEDDDGRLYAAHPTAGISVLDRSRRRMTHWRTGDHGLKADRVLTLQRAGDGRIWVLFHTGDVQWLDRAAQRAVSVPEINAHDLGAVRAIAPGPAGGLWLASETGLWRFEAGRSQLLRDNRLGPVVTSQTRVLLEDGSGTLWIGAGDGLWRIDRDGTQRIDLPFATPEDADRPEVESLLLDQNDRLWVGTRRGAFLYDRARRSVVERLDHDPADRQSLGSSRVTTLAQGADGVVWLGTWIGGLSSHDPSAAMIRTLRHQDGDATSLPADPVVAIETMPDGTMWLALGESAGLVQVDADRGVLQHHAYRRDAESGLSSDYLISLARDGDGRLWIGSGDRGLDRLDPASGQVERFGHGGVDGVSGPTVRALLVTRAGDLIVGTLGHGLAERCAGCDGFVQHRHGSAPGSLPDDRVTALAESADGRLWIGTRGSGLVLRDAGRRGFVRVPLALADSDDLSISDVVEDASGHLWIATYGDGVLRVDVHADTTTPWPARRFDTTRGLSADHVSALALAQDGSLWIATARGIDRLQSRDFSVRSFGLRAGALAGGYFLGAMATLPDGRIVAGGMEGLSLLDPSAIGSRRGPPRPQLTAFSVFNDVLVADADTRLRYGNDGRAELWIGYRDEMIGFTFAAPSFGTGDVPRFAYRLEGYDRDWIRTGDTQRSATYTRLPAGDYMFRVRSLRSDGTRSIEEATARVLVAAAPWATPFAYATYAATLLVLAWTFWSRTRKRSREREAAAAVVLENERRLNAALWGSGAELWELSVPDRTITREHRLDGLEINDAPATASITEFSTYIHPEDQSLLSTAMRRVLSGEGGTLDIAYRIRDRSGDWAWLLTRGRAVASSADGRAERFVGTNQNITDLKRAEDELRKLAEELEARVERRTHALSAANADLQASLTRIQDMQRQLVESEKMASLGALVAGVAHEINTPIGIAVTAASFLREEARKLQRAQQDKTMTASMLAQFESQIIQGAEMILANLERGIAIVRSFKQVAVDTASEAPREIDLPEYFEEILTALHPRLRKTEHRVEVQVPEPIRLRTHPVAIYQIVTNLVVNSLVHAFDGIERGRMVVAATLDGDDVVIDYHDDGHGMRAEVRDRVFEPFFTTKRGQGGSGLGMHIVFNLVTQLLRGSITCDSEPERGTRFLIRFPRMPPNP
jgi:ligand-binding sensor domain-containing protein/signal transduction histidine kinase